MANQSTPKAVHAEAVSSPSVAVVIPTYNRAHVLGRALRSVLNQSYGNLEVIVVDDGSTDETEALVNSFDDPRVRYLRCATNRGATVARNIGIQNATADFIAFQDSDDEWLCEKLEKQMALFAKAPPSVGVVYAGCLVIENGMLNYHPSATVERKSGNILAALLRGNFVTNPSVVVRRECLLSAGLYDEQLPRFQDWELFIRLAQRYEFACLDEPLLLAYYSNASITADGSRIYSALKRILEKHHDLYANNPEALARNYYDLAGAACMAGRMPEGRHYFLKALAINPVDLKSWCRLLMAMPGAQFYQRVSTLISRSYRSFKNRWRKW